MIFQSSPVEPDPSLKEVTSVVSSVDSIEKKMDGITEEIVGIEKV